MGHAAWVWAEHFLPFFATAGYEACAVSLRGNGGSEAGADVPAGGLGTPGMPAPPAEPGHARGSRRRVGKAAEQLSPCHPAAWPRPALPQHPLAGRAGRLPEWGLGTPARYHGNEGEYAQECYGSLGVVAEVPAHADRPSLLAGQLAWAGACE